MAGNLPFFPTIVTKTARAYARFLAERAFSGDIFFGYKEKSGYFMWKQPKALFLSGQPARLALWPFWADLQLTAPMHLGSARTLGDHLSVTHFLAFSILDGSWLWIPDALCALIPCQLVGILCHPSPIDCFHRLSPEHAHAEFSLPAAITLYPHFRFCYREYPLLCTGYIPACGCYEKLGRGPMVPRWPCPGGLVPPDSMPP